MEPLPSTAASGRKLVTRSTHIVYSLRRLMRALDASPRYTRAAGPIPLTVPLSSLRSGCVTVTRHGSSSSGHSAMSSAGGTKYIGSELGRVAEGTSPYSSSITVSPAGPVRVSLV